MVTRWRLSVSLPTVIISVERRRNEDATKGVVVRFHYRELE